MKKLFLFLLRKYSKTEIVELELELDYLRKKEK